MAQILTYLPCYEKNTPNSYHITLFLYGMGPDCF